MLFALSLSAHLYFFFFLHCSHSVRWHPFNSSAFAQPFALSQGHISFSSQVLLHVFFSLPQWKDAASAEQETRNPTSDLRSRHNVTMFHASSLMAYMKRKTSCDTEPMIWLDHLRRACLSNCLNSRQMQDWHEALIFFAVVLLLLFKKCCNAKQLLQTWRLPHHHLLLAVSAAFSPINVRFDDWFQVTKEC